MIVAGVGSDNRAVKLEHQVAIKIEPENLEIGFTRWVRHDRSLSA